MLNPTLVIIALVLFTARPSLAESTAPAPSLSSTGVGAPHLSPATPTTPAGPTKPAPIKMTQVLPAKDYLEFSGLNVAISDSITFSPTNAQLLYLPPEGPPYLILNADVAPDVEVSLNERWLKTPKNHLSVKVPLLFEPGRLTLKVFHPGKSRFEIYRWVYYWTKVPPLLHMRIREGREVTDEEEGYRARFPRQAFSQLYSGADPVSIVDLDSVRHADLTFRIYYPPDAESTYDAWRFIIRDSHDRIVGRYSRYGMPPHFLDWRMVAGELTRRDAYTYQINLYKNGELLEGPVNRFDTIEGGALLDHPYLPAVQIEPREEVGYFTVNGPSNYGNVFVGGSLPFVFWKQFLLRGDFQISLHQLDSNNSFTFTRVAAGLRIVGNGESPTWGHPYLYQLDVLVGSTAYTLTPSVEIKRITLMSLLVESKLVLWGAEHLVPWVEVAARPPESGGEGVFTRVKIRMVYSALVVNLRARLRVRSGNVPL